MVLNEIVILKFGHSGIENGLAIRFKCTFRRERGMLPETKEVVPSLKLPNSLTIAN